MTLIERGDHRHGGTPQAELRPVVEAVRALGEMRQRSWEVLVERAGLVGRVPEQYQAALDEVAALVDPLLAT